MCALFPLSFCCRSLCTHRISLPSDCRPWWTAPASSYNFSTEKPSDMTCHKRARYGSNTLQNLIKQQSENHHHLVNRLNWLVCLFTLVFRTAHTITTIYRRDMDRVKQKKSWMTRLPRKQTGGCEKFVKICSVWTQLKRICAHIVADRNLLKSAADSGWVSFSEWNKSFLNSIHTALSSSNIRSL